MEEIISVNTRIFEIYSNFVSYRRQRMEVQLKKKIQIRCIEWTRTKLSFAVSTLKLLVSRKISLAMQQHRCIYHWRYIFHYYFGIRNVDFVNPHSIRLERIKNIIDWQTKLINVDTATITRTLRFFICARLSPLYSHYYTYISITTCDLYREQLSDPLISY